MTGRNLSPRRRFTGDPRVRVGPTERASLVLCSTAGHITPGILVSDNLRLFAPHACSVPCHVKQTNMSRSCILKNHVTPIRLQGQMQSMLIGGKVSSLLRQSQMRPEIASVADGSSLQLRLTTTFVGCISRGGVGLFLPAAWPWRSPTQILIFLPFGRSHPSKLDFNIALGSICSERGDH